MKDNLFKYQIMFGVVLLIHLFVTISEDFILYLFDLNT